MFGPLLLQGAILKRLEKVKHMIKKAIFRFLNNDKKRKLPQFNRYQNSVQSAIYLGPTRKHQSPSILKNNWKTRRWLFLFQVICTVAKPNFLIKWDQIFPLLLHWNLSHDFVMFWVIQWKLLGEAGGIFSIMTVFHWKLYKINLT